MLIKRKSAKTGKVRWRSLPITWKEVMAFNMGNCKNADKVWPHLPADDREFIVSGITPDEEGFAYLDNVVIDGDYTVIETGKE